MDEIIALEEVSARAWPSLHRERLGGWRLYASTGHTGRANTCWALEAPDRPLDRAFATVEAWYAGHGLAPKFKTVDGHAAPAGLEDELRARGYSDNTRTLVMTGPVGGDLGDVILADQPDEAFQSILFEALYRDQADAGERLATLRRIAQPVRFARIDVDGGPAAIGAVAVDGGWGGVSVMRTRADLRRRGLAGRVLAALLETARLHGATRSYLQVEVANANAIALYEKVGFREAYRYRYWAR